MTLYSEAIPRAREYARRRNLVIENQLGGGTQGVVFSARGNPTLGKTALKSLIHRDHYERERDVYVRLKERGVDSVSGFWVPNLVNFHDELWVIEMQIVSPPYVLDFASAYIDERPPYADSHDIMAEWENSKREQFEDRWTIVKSLLAEFRQYGIYLADVKPGNIEFRE